MGNELTFAQVRDGVIKSLHKAYPNAAIFSDFAPQQVTDGSFNVILVSVREREKLGKYRVHSATFDVVYYADKDDPTDSMLNIATDLPLILETVETPSGAKVHPEGDVMPVPNDDDTLHCVVTFTYRVISERVTIDDEGHEVTDTDLMRILHLRLHKDEEADNG